MIKKIVKTRYVDNETEQEYQFEPIEDTISVKKTDTGFELKYLIRDENPNSPDEDEDDGLFLVHYHRDFWIDGARYPGGKDYKGPLICTEKILGYIYTKNVDEYDKDNAKVVEKDYWVFPVAAYIHSGVVLSLCGSEFPDQQWDVSHVGAVLAKKSEFKSKKQAYKAAESTVEEWNQYLSGDVYCCVKETLDKNKQQIDYDVVGGFFGFDCAKKCLETDF